MVKTWKESDLMNCLKCPNYWKTDIDETMCDKCGGDKPPIEMPKEMPPLRAESEVKRNG